MKLRFIIFVLALLAFLSTSIGGYLYYTALKDYIVKDSHADSDSRTGIVAEQINRLISVQLKPDRRLAEYEIFRNSLRGPGQVSFRDDASTVLKHLADSMHSSLNYLLDKDGYVVSSSDHLDPTSLLGNNYAFRPYFQEAIQGKPAIYLALGATTTIRGIYYTYPVTDNDTILGVVVFKMGLEYLDDQFMDSSNQGRMFLLSPEGVIFAAAQKDLLYKSLWRMTPETHRKISESRQFGDGPWEWTGMARQGENIVVDQAGHRFILHHHEIKSLPGWQVAFLHDVQTIEQSITRPLFKVAGQSAIAISVLVGLGVFFLFRQASSDIHRRRRAEEEKDLLIKKLRDAADEIKTLQGLIPICSFCKKIRDDQGAWNRIESYINTHSGAEFTHGLCPDCALAEYGISEEDLKKEGAESAKK